MPTTLEEAFSLANITEARYEDERPTIAITKPNNVTVRVQVQDLEQITQGRGGEPNHILLVTIHHMIYPITVEVLHQVFSLIGYVEKVVIFQKSFGFQALIQFQSRNNAIAARNLLRGCNIYEEADNTKPPLSTNTFGNNGGDESETSSSETPAKEVVDNGNGSALIFLDGYGTGCEVVIGLPEEFQEGDMVDALSRVLEQKSLENWKELDNESEDRKVERDAEREGEPNILAPFGSDRGITIWDPEIIKDGAIKKLEDNYQSLKVKMKFKNQMHKSQPNHVHGFLILCKQIELRVIDLENKLKERKQMAKKNRLKYGYSPWNQDCF
ncbi:polypyrimidine tract-binding protein homolog 3 [Tanacetum coccineum]